MQKILTAVQTATSKAQIAVNLYRWGNHFNKSCVDRIDNCMSIRWNDYSSHSRNDRINEIRTKKIDQEYGHLFRISENKRIPQEKKTNFENYHYKTYSKKDFEKYFYLEMRASMML